MKAQSKKASVFEALTNVIVGIGVAFVSQLVIFNSFGLHVTYLMNLYLTLFFTAVSIVRSYLLRRVFNWFTENYNDDPFKYPSTDTYLMTGERIPAQETEALNHLTRRYGYEKQSNGEWKLIPGFDREAWRQFCTRKK